MGTTSEIYGSRTDQLSKIDSNASSQRAIWWCALGALFFVCTTLAGDTITHLTGRDNLLGVLPMFNVRVEANLPTAFQALLLFSTGILAARIAMVATEWVTHWWMLSGTMIWLSVDEGLAIHERLNAPLRESFEVGYLYFPWVVPYGLLTTLFFLIFVRFLLDINAWVAKRFFCAGAIYVSGALAMEILQGAWFVHAGPDVTYRMIWLTGETLEMTGAILFLHALFVTKERSLFS